jgi:hypothetical protein
VTIATLLCKSNISIVVVIPDDTIGDSEGSGAPELRHHGEAKAT